MMEHLREGSGARGRFADGALRDPGPRRFGFRGRFRAVTGPVAARAVCLYAPARTAGVDAAAAAAGQPQPGGADVLPGH